MILFKVFALFFSTWVVSAEFDDHAKIVQHRVKTVTVFSDRANLTAEGEVFEQIPISEIKAVSVKYTSDLPRPMALGEDSPEGWVFWDLNLGVRQGQGLKLTLEVTTPRDYQFRW